jgi:hypothetical protein
MSQLAIRRTIQPAGQGRLISERRQSLQAYARR